MISQRKFYLLYNKNSPANKKRYLGPIDAKLFLRDLSLPIAYFLAKKGISANAVTITFLLISLFANMILIIPSIYTLIILIIIHEIAQLLDCVDGQLARYHGVSSKFGEDFDSLAHTLISGTFMLTLGSRFYLATGKEMYLIIGGIGAFAKAFEHQLEISSDSVLKNQNLSKLYENSKFKKYVFYSFQSLISGVRFYSIFLLLLIVVDIFLHKSQIAAYSFIAYVMIVFIDSLLYRIYLTIRKLNIVEAKTYKGWS